MRVKIDIPKEEALFQTTIDVQIGDINYGNHMSNERFLLMSQECRMRFLRKYELSEINIGEGKGLIMTDAVIKFVKQVYHADQLNIKMHTVEPTARSFKWVYAFYRNEELVASAQSSMLCFDYQNQKVASLPTEFLEIL